MKRLLCLCVSIASLFALSAIDLSAQPYPRTMSVQGLLEDPSTKAPYPDGTYSLTFRIYSTLTGGGGVLHTQTISNVPLTNGLFDVVLGPLDGVFTLPIISPGYSHPEYYLGITVNSSAELAPRTELTAVPYAMSVDHKAAVTKLVFTSTGLGSDPVKMSGYVTVEAGDGVSFAKGTVANSIKINATSSGSGPLFEVKSTSGQIGVAGGTGPTVDLSIAPNAITSQQIACDAIATCQILNETILAEDIATGAIASDEILNKSILSEDIACNAIETCHLGDGSITTQKITPNAITSEQILDGDVTTPDLADQAVTSQKLAADAVGIKVSGSIDFGSLNAGGFEDAIIAVTNAQLNDFVVLGVPNSGMNENNVGIDVIYMAWVSSAGNVTVRCKNQSNGTVNPDTGMFRVMVIPE